MHIHDTHFIKIITVVFIMMLASCSKTAQHTQVNDEVRVLKEDTISIAPDNEIQDSITVQKRITLIKESFLKEFYNRGVVILQNDTINTTIPFDLHSNDCGAPDCYTTTVQFQFVLGETQLQFPEKLLFQESESGCVDEETKYSGVLELKEATPEEVIYYDKKRDKTLVLFSSSVKTGNYAYYFDAMPYTITSKNSHTLLDNLDETEHVSYPYRSSVLSTFDEKEIL